MRILLIMMMTVYVASATGLAKATQTNQVSDSALAVLSEVKIYPASADLLKCCTKETKEEETQKPRCTGDNIIIICHDMLMVFDVTQPSYSHNYENHVYVLNRRFIRPPIA